MNNSSIEANLIRASYFNCTGPCIRSESQCISCLIRFWIISAQSISTLFSLVSVCHNSLLEDRPPLLPALPAGWTVSSKLCIVCRQTLQLITWFNIEIKIDQHQVVRSCTIRLAPWTLHDPCFISVVTSGHQEPGRGRISNRSWNISRVDRESQMSASSGCRYNAIQGHAVTCRDILIPGAGVIG